MAHTHSGRRNSGVLTTSQAGTSRRRFLGPAGAAIGAAAGVDRTFASGRRTDPASRAGGAAQLRRNGGVPRDPSVGSDQPNFTCTVCVEPSTSLTINVAVQPCHAFDVFHSYL